MASAPKAPDPVQTANAQAGLNRETAITQQQLNMVNQVGPDGKLTYDETGTRRFKNSKGEWIETPIYTAYTALSPSQQKIKAQTDKASLNLGTIANEQSAKLRSILNDPFKFDNSSAEAWAYKLASKRLDPRFAQEDAALRTRLIAQGIRPGTAAYDSQIKNLGETKNDAYNQLALNGRQQAFTEALTKRNQPFNEISALMSGSQVNMPQFQATPQASVAGVDYTGLVNNKFQAENAAYGAKMGGLFGLAAAPFSMFSLPKISDRRAKKDIELVGTLPNGLPWYSYRYLSDDDRAPLRQGVMSDDVRAMMPEAVTVDKASGFDAVDYSKILEAA